MRLVFSILITAVFAPSITWAQNTWRRTYGGFGSDRSMCVRQTTDGGFIVAGATGSFGAGSGDMYVVRTDAMGEPVWSHAYGSMGVEWSVGCRELSDGFIIAGNTSLGANGAYDMVLIRTDMDGEPIWERHYGNSDWDLCNSIDTVPGGFVLGGITYGAGATVGAGYLVRTDLSGDTVWTRIMDDTLRTEITSVSRTIDQGTIVAGVRATEDGSSDAFIAKWAGTGDQEWRTLVVGDSADYFAGAVQTPDGNYVASGGSHSQSTTMQILLVGASAGGGILWEQYLGSVADAAATEVRNDHDSGFVFTGYNSLNLGERDMIWTVTDDNGWFLAGNNYGDGMPADGYSVDTTADGGYVIAGWAEGYGPGPRAMYVVKTDSLGLTADLEVVPFDDPLWSVELMATFTTTLLHPNPASPNTLLHFTPIGADRCLLADLSGRCVLSRSLAPGQDSIRLHDLEPGVYQVTFTVRGRPLGGARLMVQ